jgi:hypothetical protein
LSKIVRFTAQGHAAVRATHAKTLELTAEQTITGRATCVVGVAARLPDRAVAGPVRITLSVEGESVSWQALGNSAWWPAGGSAVIRRSRQRLPDTFATDAELAAADLPRALVRALTEPAATLSVLVERLPASTGTLVRCRLAGTGPDRLLAEAAAADAVLAEDPTARSWLATAGIEILPYKAAESYLVAGGRVLAVGGTEIADLGQLLTAAGTVEVLGMPAEQAVSAAASDTTSAVLHAERIRSRDLPALAAANPAVALVLRCPADRLPRLLAELGRERSGLVLASLDDPERPLRGELADLALPERGELACRVAALPATNAGSSIDPAELVRRLLAESVTPRSIALALASLPGWSRRSAYDFVLSVSGKG